MVDLAGALSTDVYLEGLDLQGEPIGKSKIALRNNADIAKGDINHIISYIGTLVGNNADAPARVTLYLNTFQLYYSGKKGYFTIAGPLFW
jgi:hypothetical protein